MGQFDARRTFCFVLMSLLAIGAVAVTTHAQVQNPIQAAKDAYKKARPPQQQQGQQAQPPAAPAPAASSAPSAPVTADDLNKPQPAANVAIDFKVMPDLVGIHLGMPLRTAYAAMQAAYPAAKISVSQMAVPTIDKPVAYSLTTYPGVNGDIVSLGVLLPPNPQIVFAVARSTNVATGTPMNRATLLASLRQKYGKETYSIDGGAKATNNDAEIVNMYWMYDEHGNRAPMPNPGFGQEATGGIGCLGLASTSGAVLAPGHGGNENQNLKHESAYCLSSYVGMRVQINGVPDAFVRSFTMDTVDLPLAARAEKATLDFYQNIGKQQHQQEIDKSKQVRPKL